MELWRGTCTRNPNPRYGGMGVMLGNKEIKYMFQVESVTVCQNLCDSDPSCNYFTWRSGEHSIFRQFCFLFTRCGLARRPCADCHTGLRREHCPVQGTTVRRSIQSWFQKITMIQMQPLPWSSLASCGIYFIILQQQADFLGTLALKWSCCFPKCLQKLSNM